MYNIECSDKRLSEAKFWILVDKLINKLIILNSYNTKQLIILFFALLCN